MNIFEKNILSIYQEKGKTWLTKLPKQVEQFKVLWRLHGLKVCDNLSHNYVLSGYQERNPVIVKINRLSILDQKWNIPEVHLKTARSLKNELLNNDAPPVLLHGDLHQGNILSNDNQWLVIDPKGVIGYPINEMWTFVEEPNYDLKYIANFFNFRFESIVKWYYIHLILAACWRVNI